MKKSLGIDANEANVAKKVGTGQYTYQLLTHWAKNSQDIDFHLYLRNPPRPEMPKESNNWHYHIIGPQRAWTRFALPWQLFRDRSRLDVFWNPAHYLPPATFMPSVVTIHDLAYEFYPELFLGSELYKLRRWTRSSIRHADQVISVSEATKKDIVRVYGTDPAKITVIPNGYDAEFFNLGSSYNPSILEDFSLKSKSFLLFIGTLQPRKNIARLVQAFEILKTSGYPGKLVIAGNVGWMAEATLESIRSSPNAKDIVMTGYISDEVRLCLYRSAEIFVLPSLYEGFGVPVLEAMACGCPVAASNNSSLPEVVGDAGAMFDPLDPVDISRAIQEVSENREAYVEKSLAHVKKFSWAKCAAATLDLLLRYN